MEKKRKIEKERGVGKRADEEKETEENTNSQSIFQRPCVVTCLWILSSFLNMYVVNITIFLQLVFNVIFEIFKPVFKLMCKEHWYSSLIKLDFTLHHCIS